MKLIKHLLKFLTSRVFSIGALIGIQATIIALLISFLSSYFFYFYLFFIVLSISITVYIISQKDNPAYKLAWIIPILLLPVFGGLFYLLFGKRNISPKMKKKIFDLFNSTKKLLKQDPDIVAEIENLSQSTAKQIKYLSTISMHPICKNTQAELLTPGEVMFDRLVNELKKAEKFIFLEYFIIQEGKMWDTVLDIITEKIKNGVDVRLIYDDLGSISVLPTGYHKKLRELGIKTCVFNPFKPSLDVFMNYRDHRKITVIDGNIGFTGGINLADEYINEYDKHGYWKDTSVVIEGDAVWNLTVLFLQLWHYISDEDPLYEEYRPTVSCESDGYVQPFGDSPIDDHLVGEAAYMNMINNATKYVYITTPYLILDNEMSTALSLAAQSGIDVRIITPHHPDKKFVHEVTRSHYHNLIEAGVKIYEFTPGFIHSKTVVVDDELGIVGTTNFDFRSFYLHFECGVFFYRSKVVEQVYEDFMDTLKVSKEVTLEDCKKVSIPRQIYRSTLRLFAPLM
ncbi:MAG: cls [Oscillospiraceae bacterium]|nr:cls [Oscillospiraceae bacterium]